MAKLIKKIVIPVDGSKKALKSLDYIDLIYGPKHNIEVNLFHVLPSLSEILTDENIVDKEFWLDHSDVEKKSKRIAERILAEAKNVLMKKGFEEDKIKTIYQKREVSTAWDIRNWAYREQVDAVALTRRGRTDLDTFLMGAISSKLVHYSADCPVWILGGAVRSRKMLVCMDSSENALRAVDHAGFMLSGTDCQVTLFHTIGHLRCYVPLEILESAKGLEELWKSKAGEEIAPHMEGAQEKLQNAGLTKEQIAIKIVDGSRSAADDILKEARKEGYGTIVLGRHGQPMTKEFLVGSVTNKILYHSRGLAVWIVH